MEIIRCVAERNDSHYCQGYVFTQRPLRIGEKLVLQILQTDELYAGSLAFGLSSCDPSTINGNDLPEVSPLRNYLSSFTNLCFIQDPHQLIDRSEYWVVIKDVANAPRAGDEIAFKITETGEVQMFKNRQPPTTLMHVDYTQQMWAFFDLYGSTIKVKSLGVTGEVPENARNSAQMCSNRPITRRSPASSSPAPQQTSPLSVRLTPNDLKINNNYGVISSSPGSSNGKPIDKCPILMAELTFLFIISNQ